MKPYFHLVILVLVMLNLTSCAALTGISVGLKEPTKSYSFEREQELLSEFESDQAIFYAWKALSRREGTVAGYEVYGVPRKGERSWLVQFSNPKLKAEDEWPCAWIVYVTFESDRARTRISPQF